MDSKSSIQNKPAEFRELDTRNNPALTPSSSINAAYQNWLHGHFPQFDNIKSICRKVSQALRPSFFLFSLRRYNSCVKSGVSNKSINYNEEGINEQEGNEGQNEDKKDKKKDKKEKKQKKEKKGKKKDKKDKDKKENKDKDNKDKKKDKKDKKGKDKKGKDKKHKKDKGKKDKKKDKKDKKSKKDKKDKKHKKDKSDKIEESKIELIRKWLETGNDSVAQYASVSQLAINLEVQPEQEHGLLVDAATNQLRAEECYTLLLARLQTCHNDKKCKREFTQLNNTCASFAKNAHDMLANFPQSEL